MKIILTTIVCLFSLKAISHSPVLDVAGNNSSVRAGVSGKIELLNTKVKVRNGRGDASGVVVWLTPLNGAGAQGQRTRQRIIQRTKRFAPHVLAVEKGTEVDFPNLDPFFHNVFSLYQGKRFDLGLYDSGESRPVTFNRVGVSWIFCNIHPLMSAVVVTVDTPWFDVSDENGSIRISDVPEGDYRLQVWHERARETELQSLTRTVRITGGSFDLGVIRINEAGYIPRPHPNKHGRPYDNEWNQPAYQRP